MIVKVEGIAVKAVLPFFKIGNILGNISREFKLILHKRRQLVIGDRLSIGQCLRI